MQTFSNQSLLEELHKQTEIILDKAVREWQMTSPSRFTRKPAPGAWSAAQCLDHLNGYGAYYLPLLEKAINKAKAHNRRSLTFTTGWLGNYFTNLMEPQKNGTVAKKMKAPKPNMPADNVDSDAVVATFIEQQEKLLQLLEAAGPLDLNSRTIPISIFKAIKLKTGDVFRFVIAHNRRHVAQAQRALMVSEPAVV